LCKEFDAKFLARNVRADASREIEQHATIGGQRLGKDERAVRLAGWGRTDRCGSANAQPHASATKTDAARDNIVRPGEALSG
jgi:hypothetical protein